MIEPQNCQEPQLDSRTRLMVPLYFFDFSDGELDGRDQFGTKLPDVEAAAREAVGALANISKDVRKQYQNRVLALNVRSQTGETVLNVTLTLAVTRFPKTRSECSVRASGPYAEPGNVISADQFTLSARSARRFTPAGFSYFTTRSPRRGTVATSTAVARAGLAKGKIASAVSAVPCNRADQAHQ
jgi:hypothetical protein